MPEAPDSTRKYTVAWLDPDQAPLIRAVADAAGLEIIAVGSTRSGRAADAAAAIGGPVRTLDDLRASLTSEKADVFLIADPGDFAAAMSRAASDENDALALDDALALGARVFTLEPMPASLLQLDPEGLLGPGEGLISLGNSEAATGAPGGLGKTDEWATFCPLLRRSEPVRAAREVIEQLLSPVAGSGPSGLRTMVVECWSGAGQGSLGARLYDAVEAIVHFMGVPDRVDAAFMSADRPRGVHALPGESLRGLEGDLTANLRFADGRAAAVVCSSRAGRWNRSLTLIGEAGRVRVYDDGFLWIGREGQVVDSSRDPGRIRGSGASDDPGSYAVRAIAAQVTHDLDPARPPEQPIDVAGVLATAGAALLSARTGESESPATIARMARAG